MKQISKPFIAVVLGLSMFFISCEKEDDFIEEDEEIAEDTSSTVDTSSNDTVPTDTIIFTEESYALVKIYGNWGELFLWLYDETPVHKERFLWLTNNGYFDQQTFNRIVNNFVVQGGTDLDTVTNLDTVLEMSHYEKVEGLVHQLGALGAARMGDDVNPDREDMGDQWYICEEISKSDAARLDTGYVIFGQVISDLEVIKKLGRTMVNGQTPVTPLFMKIDTVRLTESYIQDSIGFNLDSLMLPQ
jgi:peptidyl-prolyl cis-trans isomerase B (cyclophilin B)